MVFCLYGYVVVYTSLAIKLSLHHELLRVKDRRSQTRKSKLLKWPTGC